MSVDKVENNHVKFGSTNAKVVKVFKDGLVSTRFKFGFSYVAGVGFMHKAYNFRKIKGNKNDTTLIEAIQCERCYKWIPVQALLDYEDGYTSSDVHKCPVGRTGKGGIHLYDFGDVSNPSVTTTLKSVDEVELYTKLSKKDE